MSQIYRQDQELPAYAVVWNDENGDAIDFSTGYTFEVKLAVDAATAPVVTKTTGITGTSAGRITIAWTAGELNVTAATYKVFLKATTSSLDRRFRPGDEPEIVIQATPASA